MENFIYVQCYYRIFLKINENISIIRQKVNFTLVYLTLQEMS